MRTDLHSTMFLLIQIEKHLNKQAHDNLHSTMFLLILIRPTHRKIQLTFTFHYVSTYTAECRDLSWIYTDLHSTMFLLIPIKSGVERLDVQDLHSTMFLLIRGGSGTPGKDGVFTFHYVSTYTFKQQKTNHRILNLHSTMFLLIPVRTGPLW